MTLETPSQNYDHILAVENVGSAVEALGTRDTLPIYIILSLQRYSVNLSAKQELASVTLPHLTITLMRNNTEF